jgi:hypothetical protein
MSNLNQAVEKVLGLLILSFLQKQESSVFIRIWTPAFAGATKRGVFQQPLNYLELGLWISFEL